MPNDITDYRMSMNLRGWITEEDTPLLPRRPDRDDPANAFREDGDELNDEDMVDVSTQLSQ